MIENSNHRALPVSAASRRNFMGGVGLGLAGLGLVAATGRSPAMAQATTAPALTDADILNFALNLEYLEAEFYLRAAFGHGLPDDLIGGEGTPGAVQGGRQVAFETPAIREYANEIANDELAHVRFIRTALGTSAVSRPTIDIERSFTLAAQAAGLIGAGETFDAYANEENFLLAAFVFEDVGVTAYKGAARFITNPDVLEAAAGILAVEAYHAGIIRSALYQRGFFAQAQAIADLRDAADGELDLDQGIQLRPSLTANLVPTDDNGLAFSRTPAQVLNIVYLGGEVANFGFFPNRVNGAVA